MNAITWGLVAPILALIVIAIPVMAFKAIAGYIKNRPTRTTPAAGAGTPAAASKGSKNNLYTTIGVLIGLPIIGLLCYLTYKNLSLNDIQTIRYSFRGNLGPIAYFTCFVLWIIVTAMLIKYKQWKTVAKVGVLGLLVFFGVPLVTTPVPLFDPITGKPIVKINKEKDGTFPLTFTTDPVTGLSLNDKLTTETAKAYNDKHPPITLSGIASKIPALLPSPRPRAQAVVAPRQQAPARSDIEVHTTAPVGSWSDCVRMKPISRVTIHPNGPIRVKTLAGSEWDDSPGVMVDRGVPLDPGEYVFQFRSRSNEAVPVTIRSN